MEVQDTEQLQLKSTARSSHYPAYPLDFAVDIIGKARKFGKNISDFHLAEGGSTTSGPFKRKKATLGYYGLLSGRGQSLQVTDLAEKILNPLNAEERESALLHSFLTPDLFNSLYNTVEKNTPISLSMLGNILIRQYGIQPSSKDDALSVFVKSGKFAHVIDDAGDNAEEVVFLDPYKKDASTSEVIPAVVSGSVVIDPQDPLKDDYQSVEIALSKGKARIVVPNELSAGDIRKLKAQIDVLATDLDDDAGSS